jgi:hypothetical protein
MFSFFIFYLLSSIKLENKREEQILPREGGLAPVGVVGVRERR